MTSLKDMTPEVAKKGGVNEIQKRAELPISIQKEDSKNKSVTRQRVDEFVRRILNKDSKNKAVTQQCIDEFVRRIPIEDKKSR